MFSIHILFTLLKFVFIYSHCLLVSCSALQFGSSVCFPALSFYSLFFFSIPHCSSVFFCFLGVFFDFSFCFLAIFQFFIYLFDIVYFYVILITISAVQFVYSSASYQTCKTNYFLAGSR